MKNPKDTISTICGIIIGFCGIIGGLNVADLDALQFPKWTAAACVLVSGLATTVMGAVIGKNGDLSSKTPAQISGQPVEAPKTGDKTVDIKS